MKNMTLSYLIKRVFNDNIWPGIQAEQAKITTICHPVAKPFYPFHNYFSPFQQVSLYFNKSLYPVQSHVCF